MKFYGNRLLVEEAARLGLEDCLIADCDLSGLDFRDSVWKDAGLRDVFAAGAVFLRMDMRGGVFFRSTLTRTSFISSCMKRLTLDALVLIRSRWQDGRLQSVALRSSCLQRAEFSRMLISACVFTDFEAIESSVENCVFADTRFTLTYGSGMNGFSGAHIRNSIFYNCRFEGFPLRGANLDNCLFIRSSGECGDEPFPRARLSPLARESQARTLLKRLQGVNNA
jgi:uncharacterized protein YjbI with pentapeptide repeats